MEGKRDRAARGIRQQPCVALLVAIAVGSSLDRWLAVPLAINLLAASLVLGAWGRIVLRTASETFSSALLLVAVGLFGAAWHHRHWNLYSSDDIARRTPACSRVWYPARIRGVVSSSVRRQTSPFSAMAPTSAVTTEWQCAFLLSASALRDGRTFREVSGNLRVFVKGDIPELRTGDEVELDGRLRTIREPLNPAEWDRRVTARAQRTLAELDVPRPECVRRIVPASGLVSRWTLAHWTDHADEILRKHLGETRHPVASALLLGRREHLSREQQDDFLRTGTVHMLAISGLHVGIVAWGLLLFTKGQFIPERLGIALVMGFTWLYTLVTGAQAPVMRANLLVQSMCLSWLLRRRSTPLNSLALAAFCVWLLAPSDLFQVGPQLSFLAVLVLSVMRRPTRESMPDDPLDRLLARHRPWYRRMVTQGWHHLRWSTWTSLAIWFFTMPLVLHRFHLIAFATVILNLLLWLPLTAALLSGLVLVLTDDWCWPLAWISARICAWSLWAFETPVTMAARCSWSYVWSCGCGTWATVGFYGVWGVTLIVQRTKRRTVFACLLSLLILLIGALGVRLPNQWLTGVRCTALAVGHGTCVVIQFPRGQVWLYDCGRLGVPDSTVDMVSRFLWSRGITKLSRVIVSHADSDHYNLLPELMERFTVQAISSSSAFWQSHQSGVRRILDEAGKRATRCEICRRGDGWTIAPGVDVEVLHPPQNLFLDSDNSNSVVVAIRAWDQSILLPGDLEGAGLDWLCAQRAPHAQFAMAPHHGSSQGNVDRFMSWCRPQGLIISGRWPSHRPWSTGPPQGKTRNWIAHTDLDGAIELLFDPQCRPQLRAFRDRRENLPESRGLRSP